MNENMAFTPANHPPPSPASLLMTRAPMNVPTVIAKGRSHQPHSMVHAAVVDLLQKDCECLCHRVPR